MRKSSILRTCFSVLVIAVFLAGCAGAPTPTENNFKDPVVTLSHVEVQTYWGWWFYGAKVEPTKGKAGNNAAPLDLAFIFEIDNPNDFPVMMERMQFTVGFEEYDINTVTSTEAMWIPPGKTNEIRLHSISDARQAQLSLLVTGGLKLKASGVSFWDALEKWWTQIPDFTFPVHVKQGSAIFKADNGVVKPTTFNFEFP